MRVSTMLATKTHFIFIVKSTEVNDELYAAEGYPAGNPIGFFAQGSAATFKKDLLTDSSWEKYSEISHQAPVLHIRSKHSIFGATAENDEVLYFSIIPREGALVGEWKKLNNASTSEFSILQNSEDTFQIENHCNCEIYRDLDTFELMEASSVSPDEIVNEDIVLNFE